MEQWREGAACCLCLLVTVEVDPNASVCLPTAVDAMQKARFDAGAITKELREAMEVRADLRESGAINELLEMLVKRRDLDVLDAVLDLLSGLQIEPDSHSYGLLIEAHVLLKNFNEASPGRGRTAGRWRVVPRVRALLARGIVFGDCVFCLWRDRVSGR